MLSCRSHVECIYKCIVEESRGLHFLYLVGEVGGIFGVDVAHCWWEE
jgi:hypothetical protein